MLNAVPYKFLRPAAVMAMLFFVTAMAGVTVFAQNADNETGFPGRGRKEEEPPKSLKEFLAKQRTEKAKKDHEELLKRGDELMALTNQLESAFARNNQLTSDDGAKLESLEKLVTRIRKGLGGDDDDDERDDSAEAGTQPAERQPSTVAEAFNALKERTLTLVDEIKKTSRFTISAMAIQSSNSVLKIVRFLRLRK